MYVDEVKSVVRTNVEKSIKKHGWHVQTVLPGKDTNVDPAFGYSVGLTETHNHPEIMMIGFDPRLMHGLLNDVGELVREGETFDDWSTCGKVVQGFDVVFRAVPEECMSRWSAIASDRYGDRPYRLLQMFLPDAQGKFPWDEGCHPEYVRLQGMLLEKMAPRILN